jgi:hypothetical protein
MGSRFLDSISLLAKGMVDIYPDGIGIFATDTEKVILLEYKGFKKIPLEVGQQLRPGTPGHIVLQSKKKLDIEMGEELYGQPLRILALPVFDDDNPGTLAGTWGMALSRETPLSFVKHQAFLSKDFLK